MAFVTDIRTNGYSVAERVADYREKWADAAAKRKLYKATKRELDVLTNRDLADLGIHRSMIKSIAMEAAYGK